MTTDTPRTDAAIWRLTKFDSAILEYDGETLNEIHCASYDEAECLVDLLNNKERELAALQSEVERLRDAFSHLTDEIECASKCSSHTTNYCDCGRLARAYAISDSIPQNPTK